MKRLDGVAQARAFYQIEETVQAMVPYLPPGALDTRHSGLGRPRILPSLCLWAGLLLVVVRGQQSQRALWRLIRMEGVGGFGPIPVSDEAVYKRVEQGGAAPMKALFHLISTYLQEKTPAIALPGLAPFARTIVALDKTTLDAVAKRLPSPRDIPAGDRRLLPGALTGLFDIRIQQWREVRFLPNAAENEKVAARDLVATLPPNSLILFDLGYFCFAWFDWLTDMPHFYVSRLRAGTSYRVLHIFTNHTGTFDALVELGAYRADRTSHAVRLVRFQAAGHDREYITNVRDPAQLSIRDIAELYARRWDIERAVQLVKQHLGLHLLWSAKIDVILQQVWAVLTVAQVFQSLKLQIAEQGNVDPDEVSMALMIQFLPRFADQGRDPIEAFIEDAEGLGFFRRSRRILIQVPDVHPRHITRAPPHLRLERTPRHAGRRCNQSDVKTAY